MKAGRSVVRRVSITMTTMNVERVERINEAFPNLGPGPTYKSRDFRLNELIELGLQQRERELRAKGWVY